MEKQLALLQQLFNETAAIHDIAIFMMDTQGKFITRSEGNHESLQSIMDVGHNDRISSQFLSTLFEAGPILQQKEYELNSKSKVILIALHNNTRLVYYIGFIYAIQMNFEEKLSYIDGIKEQ